MLDSAMASEMEMGSDESGWPLTELDGGATAKLFTMATTEPTEMRTGPLASIIGCQKASIADVRCSMGTSAMEVEIASAMAKTAAMPFHFLMETRSGRGTSSTGKGATPCDA